MNDMQAIAENLFDHVKDIAFDQVIFSDEVRRLCEANRCGHFGKSWTCPPALDSVGEIRQRLARFGRFMVFDKVYTLKSSYDWQGMVESAKEFQGRVMELRETLRGRYPAAELVVLGAGQCQLCPECTYGQGKPCRRPGEAVYSLEAHGMDILRTMRDIGLPTHHGQGTVTYIGGVFHQAGPVANNA